MKYILSIIVFILSFNLFGQVANLSSSSSGSFTPTLEGYFNTNTDSAVHSTAHYTQVGDLVFVFGTLTVNLTTANDRTILDTTLPVSSDFTSNDCSGTAVRYNRSSTETCSFVITSNSTNNVCVFYGTCSVDTDATLYYNYQYVVK